MVTKLDRLGRSLEHLIELSGQLQERGVDLVVLDQGIDTSTAVGRMFFQILGAIAEFEHALMSERTLDGLAAARARGRTGGQKPKLTPRQARIARDMYEEAGPDGRRVHTVAQIAAEFGVTAPPSTATSPNSPPARPARRCQLTPGPHRPWSTTTGSSPQSPVPPPSVADYDQLLTTPSAAGNPRDTSDSDIRPGDER